MPHVASETTSHAFRPSLHNPVRAVQESDRAQSSPFESMLDNTQAAAQPPAHSPPASGDNAAPAAQSDAAQAGGSNASSGNAPATDKPSDNGNAATDATVALDATIDAQTAAGVDGKPASDGSKPVGDGKPADSVTPADIAATLPANQIQTIAPADTAVPAVAAAPVPVTDAAPQAAPAAEHPAIIAAALPKAPPADLATLKASSGKPATDSNSPAGTAPVLQDDGKPQSAAVETSRDNAAHTRDEVPANTHHTAAAEAPPAINADADAAAPRAPGDTAQPIVLTAPSHDASTASANPAAAAPPGAPLPSQPAAIPLAGVAIEIAARALDGKNRFEIRLDPPELGRIEVRLDVDRDGNVTSRLIADRSDTLDLLRRDASGLERALQDAGLKTSDHGLQFSLRDQSMSRDQGHAATPGAAQLVVSDETLPALEATQRNYSRLAGLRGGIDIRV